MCLYILLLFYCCFVCGIIININLNQTNIMPKYPREQILELYKNLPEKLKEVASSPETSEIIYNTCKENGVKENEKISEIARNVGYVLFGLSSPLEFKKALLQEIKLKKKSAENISATINNLVFFPIKDILEKLYDIEIKRQPQAKVNFRLEGSEIKQRRNDPYREPIE